MSTNIKAYDAFLDNDDNTAQTVEYSLEELHFSKSLTKPQLAQEESHDFDRCLPTRDH